MRLRQRRSPLLLLLIPSLAATAVLASSSNYDQADPKAAAAPAAGSAPGAAAAIDGEVPSAKVKHDVGTKDAPFDGKDGRPHSGPFVEVENLRHDKEDKEKAPVKDQPQDVHIIDGKKIPQSNDGVMDDKNRPEPKEGTTGTSGGVSEKDKARKEKESMTGAKAENRPDSPKEAPPLPHSEQEKIESGQDKKEKQKSKDLDIEATEKTTSKEKSGKEAPDLGLDKPDDLPQKTHEGGPPIPNSANKDHLDVTTPSSKTGTTPKHTLDDESAGVIRPFHSFFLSLTMILFSEVGDKTFLVAALMAMKHDRMVVFSAAFSALIAMTILSAVLGHTLPALLPQRVTSFLAAGLFLVFGVRLLREGLAMSRDEGVSAEMQEVEMELAEKEHLARQQGRHRRSSISPYALEMGIDRKSRSKSRFPTPPRSPSTSPGRSPSPRGGALGGFLAGLANLSSLLLSPAWVQTFVMTFLGEWGDRSQIATIAMASGQDYWWVVYGAVIGHGMCTGVAVIGGRAIAGRVSLKVVTVGGAVAFLVFSVIYFLEAFYSTS